MLFLTGKFLIDTNSKAVKLNSGKIPMQTITKRTASIPETTSEFSSGTSDRFHSARLGTPMDLSLNRTTDFYSSQRASTAGMFGNGCAWVFAFLVLFAECSSQCIAALVCGLLVDNSFE